MLALDRLIHYATGSRYPLGRHYPLLSIKFWMVANSVFKLSGVKHNVYYGTIAMSESQSNSQLILSVIGVIL